MLCLVRQANLWGTMAALVFERLQDASIPGSQKAERCYG